MIDFNKAKSIAMQCCQRDFPLLSEAEKSIYKAGFDAGYDFNQFALEMPDIEICIKCGKIYATGCYVCPKRGQR